MLKEIEKQGLNQTLTPYQLADLCCLTLNQLPSHYIRHNVDMIYFTPDAERTEMEQKVIAALRQAYDKIRAVPSR
ncbi:Late competence development protein ComFB [compost metagenome]